MHEESVWKGKNDKLARSKCPHCETPLHAWELVPLVSFLYLRGKCSTCGRPIAWQYPIVEVSLGILFALIIWRFGVSWESFATMTLASFLMLIFLMDLKYQLILDVVTIPAIVIASLFSLLNGTSFLSIVIGSVIAGGFFALQYVLSRGSWIGGGDIRLGVLVGVMLGWPQTLLALFLTYVFGGVVATILLLRGRATRGTRLPLGTFMTVAAMVCLLFGESIVTWYRSIILL